jgi:hypothetical protein
MPKVAQPIPTTPPSRTRVQAPIDTDLHTKLRVVMVQTSLTWSEILETALGEWLVKHYPGVKLDATPNKMPPA